jgi:predicted HAD superfamily Cof-like phosphohydrolase
MTFEKKISSHFDKVCEFNKSFDYKVYKYNENALELYPKDALYRYDLIHEEGVVELGDAINNNDRVETMDGIADLLYVLYGACYTYDLNPDYMINKLFNNFYEEIRIEVFNCKNDHYHYDHYYNILVSDISEIKICLLEKKNLIELYSILIKTIIDTYKLGFSLRININKIFDIVHNSNMSKLCKTEEEAERTVEFYKNDQTRYDSPYYYKSGCYYLVKNKSTGKALKSINYTPVSF